ncbi:ribonuclease PH [SAR202 cluster bacterium AC-409-J13_OGT_754m]|nr:ribonuclease PH [SAR202 cluster bacterium AC-409-J13_OGT_754m]
MKRIDGRSNLDIRDTKFSVGYQSFAEGSVLVEMGDTKVICAASIEEKVPGWLRGEDKGWVTAEYSMLPRSTISRTNRESRGGSVKGRYQEIQRLIGRSMRAITDLKGLGSRTVVIDCDVLQADGGTRTAAINGSFVALYQAVWSLVSKGVLPRVPIIGAVGAVSVGLINNELLLDICYEEDFRAQVDFNIAMTDEGKMVELQASAEGKAFDKNLISEAVDLAQSGIEEIIRIQQASIESITN